MKTIIERKIEKHIIDNEEFKIVYDNLRNIYGPNARVLLIGGALRDIVMDSPINDYDFAVYYRPGDRAKENTVEEFSKHEFDIGKLQIPKSKYCHGQLITKTSSFGYGAPSYCYDITRDLLSKDFTCNSMAYDPTIGSLYDPMKGLLSIKQGLIVPNKDAKISFSEDETRIKRAFKLVKKGLSLDLIIEDLKDIFSNYTNDDIKRIILPIIDDVITKEFELPVIESLGNVIGTKKLSSSLSSESMVNQYECALKVFPIGKTRLVQLIVIMNIIITYDLNIDLSVLVESKVLETLSKIYEKLKICDKNSVSYYLCNEIFTKVKQDPLVNFLSQNLTNEETLLLLEAIDDSEMFLDSKGLAEKYDLASNNPRGPIRDLLKAHKEGLVESARKRAI